MELMNYLIPFLVQITIVVFIHEYGHYYFAKKYCVGITDFSIGFGREIFGWNDKSGTRWKICWIPLGGYVKFFGDRNVFSESEQQEVINKYDEKDRKKLFILKPLYQRSIIVAAGPLANFFLAILIFIIINMIAGKDMTPAVIDEVVKDSPADIAGLNAKDVIIGMNSIPISDYNELRNKVSSAKPGDVIVFNVLRNKVSKNIIVTLGLRPSEDQLYAESISSNYDLLGFKVENNKDSKGVLIVDIDSNSNAYDKNIRIGDVITELGNEKINNIDEYNNILKSYNTGDAVMIRIVSNGSPRYEAFEINQLIIVQKFHHIFLK